MWSGLRRRRAMLPAHAGSPAARRWVPDKSPTVVTRSKKSSRLACTLLARATFLVKEEDRDRAQAILSSLAFAPGEDATAAEPVTLDAPRAPAA